MDKLTREAHDHGRIVESMVFFEQFLKTITSNEIPDYTERLHQFFDQYIVQHFSFEEKEVFPILLTKGDAQDKKLVQELLEDHASILRLLAEFRKIIFSFGPQPNTGQVKKIITSSETMITAVLAHTDKEDKKLFPALRKYDAK
ncbi:MAG: hemerythrin domain-containing protein [Candidatus Electrothrix sp. YB6]